MKLYIKIIMGIALSCCIIIAGAIYAIQNNKQEPVSAVSSLSLAHSYNTLEELAYASALVAEVTIDDVIGTDTSKGATFYSATIGSVLKGSYKAGEKIIITQDGIEDEMEKTGKLLVSREDPLMEQNDNFILFLKEGTDENYGTVYYIAGSYQGKFQVKDGNVFSVNLKDKKPYLQEGQHTKDEFKEQIKEEISKQ